MLFSINSPELGQVKAETFAKNVSHHVRDWGVDGVDIFYAAGHLKQDSVVTVLEHLRTHLHDRALMTAPIFEPWLHIPGYLQKFASNFDYLMTMDYTPHPGYQTTLDLYKQYAAAIGTTSQPAYDKLAIGMSCMGPAGSGNYTPLDDVVSFCKWEPSESTPKQGVMLYTFSYDEEGRLQPPGTYTNTIHEYLP